MRISACWIVKNEAAHIARSIESLQEAVDELIVVDTGSTDDTVEIARSLGAKTDYFQWISDFSAARNYALSLATGEFVFFLDADEWFEPKLDREQRGILERLLASDARVESIMVPICNLDMNTGLVIDKATVIRAYYNREDIRYRDKIHESIQKPGKAHLFGVTIEHWNLNHFGYTSEMMWEKMHRNIALLEHEAETADPDDPATFKLYFYLMREYVNIKEREMAFQYFLKLRYDYRGMKQFCRESYIMAPHYFYTGMNLSFVFRERISRRDVYESLIVTMKKLLPDYPGSETIQLDYQVKFDLKEDRFLKELEPAIKAAGKKKTDTITHYQDAHARFFAYATRAAWRRGNKEQAFEYAHECFIQSGSFIEYDTLEILLNCLKGQPQADIILFLNSIFGVGSEEKRGWMMKGLQMEGYATVYTYYLKKQLEQGTVATDGYLLLLILLGRYDEAVQTGISQYEEIPEVIKDNIFLAVICSGKETLYRDNSRYLEGYEHILEAYFSGNRLENVTENDRRVLVHHYKTVAFVVGREKAQRLLEVFRKDPRLCFFAKARYCIQNGLFEEVLKEDRSFLVRSDFTCLELLVCCYSATGHYGEALDILQWSLEDGLLDPDVFHWLLVVAEKAEGCIRETARGLYDSYMPIFDEIIDLRDVINTKIVFDDSSKKQRRALIYTTMEQFEKLAAKDAPTIPHRELLEALFGAAAMYEEKEMYAMAQQCYRRLYASGYKLVETCKGLSRVFEKLGNKELAGEFGSGDFLISRK